MAPMNSTTIVESYADLRQGQNIMSRNHNLSTQNSSYASRSFTKTLNSSFIGPVMSKGKVFTEKSI